MGVGRLIGCVVSVLAAASAACASAASAASIDRIEHIIVIYAENRSFDNLYGLYPGARGIKDALAHDVPQVDRNGAVLSALPPVWSDKKDAGGTADPSYPTGLPNRPFRIDRKPVAKPLSVPTRDLVHRFYQNQEQIDGGRNDRFAAVSDAGGLVMGYYDGSKLPMWSIARRYTLADHAFMGAFGGSMLNHFWLVCACTPEFKDADASIRATLDGEGRLARKADSPASAMDGPPALADGAVTPDGYGVNTLQPPYQPSGIKPAADGDPLLADPAAKMRMPPQTARTIGDALSEKGVSWAWYAGAWNQALADRAIIYDNGKVNFQPHHQPFNYFLRFAPGTADRAEHLKDGGEFLRDIDAGTLPQVAFYKPQGNLNEHPGYAEVLSGDRHIVSLIQRIQANTALWRKTAIIVAYDENGGFWDHVPPPAGDRWGPGNRVPLIIVSPFAKKRHVDHTQYDTTSIIKFITRRFALEPLAGVRANAGDLTAAFE